MRCCHDWNNISLYVKLINATIMETDLSLAPDIDELQMEVDRKDLSPDKSQVKGNMVGNKFSIFQIPITEFFVN